VSTLIKWFPDRPGLATGMAIMGFGGGAFIASALSSELLQAYTSRAADEVPTDAVVPAFITLGLLYLVFMMFGVFSIRIPARAGSPRAGRRRRTRQQDDDDGQRLGRQRHQDAAVLVPLVGLFCNVTAGIGILEQASPMIQDFFPTTWTRRPQPASSACCRCSTWPAGSSGRRRPTTSAASRRT
jgi:MFS family permease